MKPRQSARSDGPGGGGTPPTLSRAVLEQVRRRDPEALTALYDACFDRVYSVAYRLMGERMAAEDITQEVFLKVYRAAHRLDPDRDPGPWLVTITYNACRDHWRSKGDRMTRSSSSTDEHPGLLDAVAGGGPRPDAAMVETERDRAVQEAIMSLPPDLRTVVVLHDYQDLNHAEIAGVVGASHAAVRKRYSRALEKLGEALKDSLR